MARPKTKAEDNGSISARELPAGGWQASTYFRTLGGELKRVRKTGSTKGQALAALKAEVKKRQAAGGSSADRADQLVRQTAASWLASIKAQEPIIGQDGQATISATRGVTAQTHEQYTRYAGVITAGIGGVETATLTARQCEAFLHGLVDVEAGSGYSTARLSRVTLSLIMAYAIRMGLRRENPVNSVTPLPKKVSTPLAPSPELITQMRAWIKAYLDADGRGGARPLRRVGDVFEILLATGARIGEVMALRWEDIDLEEGTLSICGTLIERGALYRQQHPKTDKSFRTLRLTGWALELLRELHGLRDPNSSSGGVFVTKTGRFASMSGFRRAIRGALIWGDARDQEGVNPHAFRKAVATILADGLGEGAAMQQLGHSSPEVTRRHYIQRAGVVPDYRPVLESLAPRNSAKG